MVGLHVIVYLLRVPWVWGFPWGFQWGFLWVWDGYGDWNDIPTAALVGRGRIWLTPLNSPTPKTTSWKQEHISHTSSVITNFDPNFVAMTTRVGRGKIWLTSFNSRTPKTPCRTWEKFYLITPFSANPLRDIRDQNLKLSEIAPNFWTVSALSNFRGTGLPKSCTQIIMLASRHVIW